MFGKQGIAGGIIVPHPPLIIPEVGRGQERKIMDTVEAYNRAAALVAEWKPETVVVLSPHALMYADYFHISSGKSAEGNFGLYMAPEVSIGVSYDNELVEEICREAEFLDFPMGNEGEGEPELDHGTMIPLYFINRYYRDYKVVRVGGSGLSFEDHYRAGQIIAEAAGRLGRRIILVGSGDLSHRLKTDGPYGYSPQGPQYDARIMDVMGRGAFGELLEFTEGFCEKAGECGHRSFTTMAGILDGLAVRPQSLSYEGPFGVGYGICTFEVIGEDKERRFLDKYQALRREQLKEKQGKEDDYVALARKSLEHYVRTGRTLALKKVREKLSSKLIEEQAGVFVSIHKNGSLRGCIGTISPVCDNVAQEIIANAVSAGIHDPRFPSVREEELEALVYSVDVLGETEAIASPEELDVKRYGVIVSKGHRRGLLLPNLEGIDTVEEQLAIAKQKAGISPEDDNVELERFEVIRHGDKG